MNPIKIHEFPNRCRFVYQKSKNTMPITAINVVCNFGSAHESDENRGVAHFIEHMCFKGTKKIPQSKELFREYDDIGAYFNAFTYKRYTVYVVKCIDDYVENSIQVLSDMVLNSTFNKREFDKELKVVIEENINDLDDNLRTISDMTDRMIYQGTPFAFPIDSMSYHGPGSLNYKNVVNTYRSVYHPCNFIISITSNLSFTALQKMITKSYFFRKNGEPHMNNREHMQLYLPTVYQYDIRYEFKRVRESSVTLVNISFRTCSQYSGDKYVLNILKIILGGYFSSRLFLLLREDNGLTYNSSVETEYSETAGDFTISATTDSYKFLRNGKNLGVLPLIINMLNDLREKGISQKELTLAKHHIRGKLAMEMENINNVALYNAEQTLFYPETTEKIPLEHGYETHYAGINMKKVNTAINTYIIRERMNVCVLGQHLPSERTIKGVCDKFIR